MNVSQLIEVLQKVPGSNEIYIWAETYHEPLGLMDICYGINLDEGEVSEFIVFDASINSEPEFDEFIPLEDYLNEQDS